VNAARRGDGFTPLCLACKHGNVAMVERLIAAGSQVDKASNHGTPLMFAANDNRLDLVTLLIAAGADVNKAGLLANFTPLHIAAQNGHAGVVSVLLETPGMDLNPALLDDEGTRSTLRTIADIRGRTLAGFAGITPLFMAAQTNRLEVVKLLIAAGADVNMVRVDGKFPFHIAAQNGHADVVELLIAAGANVHATLTSGATALSLDLAKGHAEVVQKLMAAGAT
jgi:ankyrin repeat protein